MTLPVWTNPTGHVFAVGEVVTASTLNTYVQQNIANLGAQIKARMHYNAAASVSTGVAVPFDTVDYDPNSNCTTGVGALYTAPVAGYYDVVGMIYQSTTAAFASRIYKNGTAYNVGSQCGATVGGSTVVDFLLLAASDTIDLRPSGTVTTSTTAGLLTYLAVAYAGPNS